MMAINRRSFLAKTGLLISSITIGFMPANAVELPSFASAFTDFKDHHYVGLFSPLGKLIKSHKVPSRGHAATFSKDGRYAVFFARRPGNWMLVIEVMTGKVFTKVAITPGRHFYGHGVFSHDQSLLFVTENDYENARGVIGVYDVTQGFKRVRELLSYGVGPHELALLSDGQTLVVANGGIETHPEYGRIKLNIETMSPRLTYIDSRSGDELSHVLPPHHKLSLRHLTLNDNDEVIVGAQFQGGGEEDLPLIFRHKQGETLRALSGQPLMKRRQLNSYIASVTFSSDGQLVVSSSPRGDRVSLWDANSGWLRDINVSDVGGVAQTPSSNHLLLSSGNGQLYLLSLSDHELKALPRHSHRWDNHLVAI
ncbi:MAG: hypothetical protein ACI84K_001747 [Pseudohongiellaceae bacterium]|jgi:hypothetical protein